MSDLYRFVEVPSSPDVQGVRVTAGKVSKGGVVELTDDEVANVANRYGFEPVTEDDLTKEELELVRRLPQTEQASPDPAIQTEQAPPDSVKSVSSGFPPVAHNAPTGGES